MRSFVVAGPCFSNLFFCSLDTFAKLLKTHLFGMAHTQQGMQF